MTFSCLKLWFDRQSKNNFVWIENFKIVVTSSLPLQFLISDEPKPNKYVPGNFIPVASFRFDISSVIDDK